MLGRLRHERLLERALDGPRRVLEPASPRQGHAAPRPPVQLHQPRPALLVAEELEHEQPAPPDVLEQALCGAGQARVDRDRLAGRRRRALGVQHPHTAVGAPGRDAPVARDVAEETLPRAVDQRLDDERRVPALLAHALELRFVGHRGSGGAGEAAVHLVERECRLHDGGVRGGRHGLGALHDLALRNREARSPRGFELQRLVQRVPDELARGAGDGDRHVAERARQPDRVVVEGQVGDRAGLLEQAAQVAGRCVRVGLGGRDLVQLDVPHAAQGGLRSPARECRDTEPGTLQRPGRLDRRHRLGEADQDRLARHRHRLTAVRRDATRPFRAPGSRSSEAGVSVERIV